jgi:AraC-like DNA-binding protein
LDSLFFNITDKSYKREENKNFTRVDISNGILFLESYTEFEFHLKNLDRMLMITYIKNGKLTITEHTTNQEFEAKNSQIFASTRQDITIKSDGDVFILFIADFFLKRYLSSNQNDPIDYLYQKIQKETFLELVDAKSIDALSLYIIQKITKPNTSSIKCEHNIIELIMHRFSLLDIIDKTINQQEREIATKAKNHLLKTFINPPTIPKLSHICATNESKLKKSFKKVYKTTIYSYIQKLRLKEANLLLKEQSLSIKEVALKVGYKHQGHFSKLFFENFGVYPKDLLRK